jgi:hypothetical protein
MTGRNTEDVAYHMGFMVFVAEAVGETPERVWEMIQSEFTEDEIRRANEYLLTLHENPEFQAVREGMRERQEGEG